MNRFIIAMIAACAAMTLWAQTVSIGNFICNPGARFVVPVMLDDATGISFAAMTVNYDATLLVLKQVKQGDLEEVFDLDFIVAEDTGSVTIITFGRQNATGGSGTIAELVFQAREGCAALYSDIALASVTLCEKSVTKDLTVERPLTPKSGMLRAYGETAKCTDRLVEGALYVAPETKLDTLVLEAGDTLCVADSQKPIVVSAALTAAGAVRLAAPENGWATATYEILQAPTAGLSFDPATLPEGATVTETTADGMTCYLLAVVTDTEVGVETDVELLPADENAIRSLLEDELEGIATIRLEGDEAAILAGIDLGIKPVTVSENGVLTATFALPELTVTAFDVRNGIVKVRVVPAAGATIANPVVTGVLSVYGSEKLGETMTKIEDVEVDISAYCAPETPGEVSFRVVLGTKTYMKVVAGRVTSAEE